MNKISSRLKSSLFLSLAELLLFFFIFLLIEYFYLNKELLVGVKEASSSTLVRILYLQVLVEYVAVVMCFKWTKNACILYAVMVAIFFSYYSLLRGEVIPFELLFGFGLFGKTTPSFLVFLISSLFAIALVKRFKT